MAHLLPRTVCKKRRFIAVATQPRHFKYNYKGPKTPEGVRIEWDKASVPLWGVTLLSKNVNTADKTF